MLRRTKMVPIFGPPYIFLNFNEWNNSISMTWQ